MSAFENLKEFRITKENVTKYGTWIFILKFLVVAFVAGFFLRTIWPTKPATRTVIVGEGELNAEAQQQWPQQQGRMGEPQIEPQAEVVGPNGVELQGVAMQIPQAGAGGALDESLNSIVTQVRAAVVKVIVVPGRQGVAANPNATGVQMGDPFVIDASKAVGSGVIIDAKGLFLTTKHVVGENNNLQVVLYRGGQNQFTARVIARDPDSPLVIAKIRATQQFPFARMGDSDRVRTGDAVAAVGNPFSLSGTVTSGIISGRRDVTVGGLTVQGALQTDATINDGNAGGPLVNMDGEVIGITFGSYVQGGNFTGIGFAVPINFAKEAWGTAP